MASSKVTSDDKKLKTDHIIVAAIDFGTTYTGYAYSFKDDPSTILTSRWSGENIHQPTVKTPTCVLISPDKEFVAFGYDAEEKYRALIDEGTDSGDMSYANSHYYFERFKMKLYQTKLRLDTKLSDAQGKELPAIDVFTAVIKHLKDRVHKEMKNTFAGFQDDDILWVLTVPAIWSDSAKQFMRKAANKAGIEDSRMKLVLEPEAASLFCNEEKICKVTKLDGSTQLETFPEGMKYIVADLGGGTADISVHEILSDRNLKEIHRADGDALGGILVDQEFLMFLVDIFGSTIIQHLTSKHTNAVLDIQRQFETKKRTFNFETPGTISITIPRMELEETMIALNEESVKTKIQKVAEKKGFETIKLVASNKLNFGKDIMERFFQRATDGIISFINKMRQNDELGQINHLLMVGGFSEAAYVQHVIKKKVRGIRVIIPPEPSFAVLKGAVIAGRNPTRITERIARYTYGFSFARPFKEGEDPNELKFHQNGKDYCNSVFDKIITKGDVLKVGDHFGTNCAHVLDTSGLVSFLFSVIMPISANVYRSAEKDPKYSKEKFGCELIGLLLIPPPEDGWPLVSNIEQELVVGEAEFTVRAINKNTGEVYKGQLDFLQSVSRENQDENEEDAST